MKLRGDARLKSNQGRCVLVVFVLAFLNCCGGSRAPLLSPSVTLSISSGTITITQSADLTWSTTSATSCTASATPAQADWSGSVPTSGAQTVTPAAAGTVTYTLVCSGAGGDTSRTATVTANAFGITTGNPPPGIVRTRYFTRLCNPPPATQICFGFLIKAIGGTAPYVFTKSAGTLPSGVTLNAGGLLDGTPFAAGTFQFTVTVTDHSTPVIQSHADYTLIVSNPPPPAISSVTPPNGALNLPYDFHFAATNGLHPLTWMETGALPAGLTLSPQGELFGTPTASGPFLITFSVQDAAGQSAPLQSFTIHIFLHGFQATGDMTVARSGATTTLLNSGKVLIAGGIDGTSSLATAELFDSATGTFTSTTGTMTAARSSHTATLLAHGPVATNGKVLITGGTAQSAELFDPATGTFTSTTGAMNHPRSDHTATLLNNGKVLLAGGYGNTAELFDPATGTFTSTTGAMKASRESPTSTLLNNGMVLIAGGFGDDLNTNASADLYNPATGTFTPTTGTMTTARSSHTATLLNNGKVLVTGGFGVIDALATAELFDPAGGTFSLTGSLETPRASHIAILLNDGTVLVTGGTSAPNADPASAELFDTPSGTFTPTGSMVTARSAHTATLLNNGQVLVTGGQDTSGVVLKSAELYK